MKYFREQTQQAHASFLNDALGGTLALTDGSGTTQTSYTFEPFGNTSTSGSATTNSFAYTGRELDAGNLYFNRARYYNPQLQRFISADPAGLAGGINSYSYAGNGPSNFRDPTGLDYNVNYDPNTNTLVVSAAVGIYGPDASSQLANSWRQSASNYWNARNWKYGHCNVRFSFTFNFLPDFHHAWDIGPQNVIFAEPDTIPGDIRGFTRTNYGYWSRNMLPRDVAHEMGHVLFLPDDYGIFSFGDHSGHMMSKDPVRSVVQHEVDDVLAGRACGCK